MKAYQVLFFFLIATTVISAHTKGDFGVCGAAADPAVYRPSNQTLYYLSTCSGTYSALTSIGQNSGDQWLPFNDGGSSDVFGDFSGFSNRWNVYDRFGGLIETSYGWYPSGGTAFAGDVDGDGHDDFITYYQGEWTVVRNRDHFGDSYTYYWGDPNQFDKPVVGDFNGDGKAEIAYWRPGGGGGGTGSGILFIWYLNDGHKENIPIQSGPASDRVFAMDIDGDGKDEAVLLFEPQFNGDTRPYNWTFRESSNGLLGQLDFGVQGDIPVPADYLGQGKEQIAIFRPSTGEWKAVDLAANAVVTVGTLGTTGDVPVQGGRVH